MIISHKHKFIFLHCRKNAGSSVSVSLYRYLGPFDIAIGSWDDAINNGIFPNKRMYFWAFQSPSFFKFTPDAINSSIKRKAIKVMPGTGATHATASQIKLRFPQKFKKYKKFCIIRNPYDRVISDYYWRLKVMKKLDQIPSFSEYLNALKSGDTLNGFVPKLPDNWNIYTIDNQIAVDYICFYENLENDLKDVLVSDIGLNWDSWMPLAKQGKLGYDYSSFYTEKEKQIVYEIFSKEIETFGYKF